MTRTRNRNYHPDGYGSYKYVKEYRIRLKQKCVDYLGGKCCICGYDKCNDAFDFHHRNPEEKEFAISAMKCASFDRLKPELDKCILVCRNCHAEIHAGIVQIGGREGT